MLATHKFTDNKEYGKVILDRILDTLKCSVGTEQFNKWFSNLKFLDIKDGVFIISVKNKFIREWLINNYFGIIKHEIRKIDNSLNKISLVLDQNFHTSNDLHQKEKPIFSRLNTKFTFEKYVVVDENQLPYKVLKTLASGDNSYHSNIFYLCSEVGMGKTHLLQATANYIAQNFVNKKVGYLSAEKFMYTFVQSVKKNQLFDLRERYFDVDVFIIDDIHFICGKESTQREFSLILNALIELGKTIIIASTVPAHFLEFDNSRTKSLLISSNMLHIKKFTASSREKVLSFYNSINQINFSQESINLMVNKIDSNIRELEAGLNNLTTYLALSGQDSSFSNISAYIRNFVKTSTKEINIDNIMNAVSKFYKLSTNDIISKSRMQKIVKARIIVAQLAKELTSDSLGSIGSKLGKRNHATVLYYINKFNFMNQKHKDFSKEISVIKNSIIL